VVTDTAEDIVRALADGCPLTLVDYGSRDACAFCGVDSWESVDKHAPGCEWRRAVEWVEANPK
jgi:hypothetical protein